MHWKVEPLSVEVKPKLAEVELVVPEGPLVIEVSGAVVSPGSGGSSTLQLRTAGVASVLLAGSVALTENWCEPIARPGYDFGAAQLPQPPLSSLHSKLEFASLEAKPKLAVVVLVDPDGPLVIVVSGAVVSPGGGAVFVTVQLRTAGVASELPAASVALTENWCAPTAIAE